VLLLNANEVVSRDRLIDELWGEDPPDTAAKLVQVYVSRLRKALEPDRAGEAGDVLITQAPGYVVRVGPDELDIKRFELLADAGQEALSAGAARDASERFAEALALWRGPALADFVFEPFAEAEIGRLEGLRVAALEGRLDADLALGREAAVLGELEAMVAEHPLRERLRAQLMRALYQAGRQAEALEAYREARNALTEELGIEPGRELRELHEAILRQDAELDRPADEAAAPPARSVRDAERPPALGGTFVGRERELADLHAALEEALKGRGGIALVAGEPGIGKSRLTDELIQRARERDAAVVVGRCWEAGGAPAYWPWVQALRACARAAEPDLLREQLGAGAVHLGQLLPELRERFADLPEPAALDPEAARFRLFEAVSGFLGRAAEARPLVLALDDVHAADDPSLLLLQFVAREIADSQLLVICAYRDVDPALHAPLVEAVAELVREPATVQIELEGLGETDVAEYIQRATGVEAAPGLVRAIRGGTEGNPLFVVELVRLLDAEGRIGEPDAHVRIPPGLRAVIGQRVSRLSEGCRDVLVPASVMGREVELDALVRLDELSRDRVLDALDEAIAERILGQVPGSPGRVRFGHALIRDVLYDDLAPARRMQLHRDAADAVQAVHSEDLSPHLTELAHHYFAAAPSGVADKAVEYARRAGDRAASQLAYEEAARLYEMALTLVEEPATRCDLLLALGEAHARAGDSQRSKRAFREAAELADEAGLAERLALAALGYGGRIIWERHLHDEYLVPLLERAAAALGDTDSPLRVRLLARLAGGPLRSPQFPPERRFKLSHEAIQVARRLGDPATLAYALDARIPAIESPERTGETLELSTELLEVAMEAGDQELVLEAHEHRHERFVELGEMDEAEAELEAMRRLAEELRQPAQRWLVSVCRARLALQEGRFQVAEALIEEARELGEHALSWNAMVAFRAQLYMLSREQGRLEDARELLARSGVEYPDYELWPYAMVQIEAARGNRAKSEKAFRALATDDFAGLPFDQNAWFVGMGLLAETAASLGDVDRASVLYRLLLPYADRVAVCYPELGTGSVSRYLGLLTATTGRWDEAERHFEGAVEMNQRIGARPWLAHTQADYARLLSARRRPGDGERALELARHALAGYEGLGMDTFAADAGRLERSLGAAPAS
jgi:DNA-binding SARP family transcriptional activator